MRNYFTRIVNTFGLQLVVQTLADVCLQQSDEEARQDDLCASAQWRRWANRLTQLGQEIRAWHQKGF